MISLVTVVVVVGVTLVKLFLCSILLNMCSKTEFCPISLNCYLSNEKNTFVENSRVEPTIFFMENFIFFETFIWPFYESLRLSDVLESMHAFCVQLY